MAQNNVPIEIGDEVTYVQSTGKAVEALVVGLSLLGDDVAQWLSPLLIMGPVPKPRVCLSHTPCWNLTLLEPNRGLDKGGGK